MRSLIRCPIMLTFLLVPAAAMAVEGGGSTQKRSRFSTNFAKRHTRSHQ